MTGAVDYHLGEVSERYESTGPGTISTGHGDHGGVSYGTYQLATATGTLTEYLKQSSYRDHFKGLTPNTKTFDAEWRTLASEDLGFAKDQHDFIKTTHYDPVLAALKQNGLDLSGRGIAVKEAIWSTSVQYGKLATAVFENGISDKFGANYKLSRLTDKDIVEAVQDYKLAHIDTLFRSSSAGVRASIRVRAVSEREDLVALADGLPLPEREQTRHIALRQGAHGDGVERLQSNLRQLGYLNAHAVDGQFGPHTMAAVERFQHDHGLAVDGIVGSVTRQRLAAGVRDSQAVAATLDGAPDIANESCGFSDPGDSRYAMQASLKALLPRGTSEARLAQATAACHLARMHQPEDLAAIYSGKNPPSLIFMPNNLLGRVTEVDLSRPAPSVQQSMQQVQAFDQAQVRQPGYASPQIDPQQPAQAQRGAQL